MRVESERVFSAFSATGAMSEKDLEKAEASAFAAVMSQTEMKGGSSGFLKDQSLKNVNAKVSGAAGQKNLQDLQLKGISGKEKSGIDKNVMSAQKTDKAAGKTMDDTTKSQMKELSDEVKKEIADALDVTEEEVEEALETLGLQISDLLDLSQLSKVVMELTEIDSPMELLTDANIQDLYQNLTVLLTEATEELQTDVEGLTELMQGFEEEIAKTVVAEEAEPVREELHIAEPLKEQPEHMAAEEDRSVTQDTEEAVIVVEEETSAEEEGETDDSSAQGKTSSKTEGLKQETEAFDKQGRTVVHAPAYQEVGETASQQPVSVIPESYNTADLESIYRQVNEAIRLRMSSDTTSMEFSLNPQQLGKVSVELASKNGVVTAQFRTEDAMSKAALESQVAELKNSLENQGIKVEAIEVTVASHEFERNLEERQQDQQKLEDAAREMNEKAADSRRSLSLGVEEGIPENLTEAEELMAKMMSDNGNRLSLFV